MQHQLEVNEESVAMLELMQKVRSEADSESFNSHAESVLRKQALAEREIINEVRIFPI